MSLHKSHFKSPTKMDLQPTVLPALMSVTPSPTIKHWERSKLCSLAAFSSSPDLGFRQSHFTLYSFFLALGWWKQ